MQMRLVGIALCGLVIVAGVWAEDEAPPTITVDITNGDVHEALAAIARQGGLNISVNAKVKGVVTAALRDVTPEEALRTIAGAVGARVRQDGEVYIVEPKPLPHERPRTPSIAGNVVAPARTGGAATGDIPVGDGEVIRVIHLRYADPALLGAAFGGGIVGSGAGMMGGSPFHPRGGRGGGGYGRSSGYGNTGGYGGGYGSRRGGSGGFGGGYDGWNGGGGSRVGQPGFGGL
jgi:hypothetical protein